MADAGAGEKLKVFISYSRTDSAAFADELVAFINNIAESDFRHAQPASDIDTAAVDGLKALDRDLPIREADIGI